MKFLAGLVQAAVASQIVFDSHDPVDEGAEGTTISRDYGAAMQFRTPAAANDACDPEGLTVELVTFTMHTVETVPLLDVA
ncbi:hypothetical protein H310_13367 [Aphanomyces invadans]|uniref:Uncharacterized protein n=1 Tax=Aphanomyces invadans TaxID=157072 RepID=A0A024TE36_9STRA|nr:hypothetical protein H310_13367 [Aphanomyces invadans]ETV92313.1 hypothetical protein H310_13367 [Aphanomyces invadans]|eukprot:XP_008879064.1 hypothetical protein H310_13367 [Aphanomyces invadans]